MSNSIWGWTLFNVFVLLMLGVDLFFHRESKAVRVRDAIYWSIFWIALALGFNALIYFTLGAEPAISFLTGYLVEKSLSVDNLFVFLMIFNFFKTPEETMHKVLFWGVLGAIIMRAVFIFLGIALLSYFHFMIYAFGFLLIFTGIRLFSEQEKEIQPNKNPVLVLFRYFFPVTDTYVKDRFFIRKGGKTYATPLFIVLLAIETSDVIFAVDSIPAILAITKDPFIVYTSNIFAILGLRSLYFVLQHAIGLFHYLHYGLGVILIFIGSKMMLEEIYQIPTPIALGVVFCVLTISVIASILLPKHEES